MSIQKLHNSKSDDSYKISVARNNKNFRKCDLQESKKINTLLNEDKWLEGLSGLLVLVQQCDENLLLSEGSKWFKKCSQIFSKAAGEQVIISAAYILRYLLRKCHEHPKLKDEISKLSSSFLTDLCKDLYSIPIVVFELIYEYLILFSRLGMPSRAILEKTTLSYLLVDSYINEEEYPKVVAAARLFSALPASGTYLSENRIKNKSDQLMDLLSLAHKTMDKLFKTVREIESYHIERKCNLKITNKDVFENDKDPVMAYMYSATIFCNCLTFVQEFISYADSNLKMKPVSIRSILMRPLQVYGMETRNDMEFKIFQSFLPNIHQRTLITLKNMLLKHPDLFDNSFELILQRLEYCLKYDKESSPLSSRTKELVYDVLSAVCAVSEGSEVLPISLCAYIIRDITPKKQLVISNKNEKSTKKIQDTILIKSQVEYYGHVIISALNFVTEIYSCNLYNISNLFAQKLNACLMTLFLNLNEGPYLDPKVRKAFYIAFKACICAPRKNVPISYSRIVNILQYRKQEDNFENGRVIRDIIVSISFKLSSEENRDPSIENTTNINAESHEGMDIEEENESDENPEDRPESRISDVIPNENPNDRPGSGMSNVEIPNENPSDRPNSGMGDVEISNDCLLINGHTSPNDTDEEELVSTVEQQISSIDEPVTEEAPQEVEDICTSVEKNNTKLIDISEEQKEVEIYTIDEDMPNEESQTVSVEVSKMMDLFNPSFQ